MRPLHSSLTRYHKHPSPRSAGRKCARTGIPLFHITLRTLTMMALRFVPRVRTHKWACVTLNACSRGSRSDSRVCPNVNAHTQCGAVKCFPFLSFTLRVRLVLHGAQSSFVITSNLFHVACREADNTGTPLCAFPRSQLRKYLWNLGTVRTRTRCNPINEHLVFALRVLCA